MKHSVVETIQRVSLLCLLAFGVERHSVRYHLALLLHTMLYCSAVINTPRTIARGRQRIKMKKRVGACCASEWGHGSAVSPRCCLLFWCWELGLGLVFNVMQLWRLSVWSYAWVGLISSFFLICFCVFFPPLSLSSLSFFFFSFCRWEAQVTCLK